jgi:hypothetical protein
MGVTDFDFTDYDTFVETAEQVDVNPRHIMESGQRYPKSCKLISARRVENVGAGEYFIIPLDQKITYFSERTYLQVSLLTNL